MEIYEFLSISAEAQGFHRVKGSRFLAYAYPFTEVEKLNEILDEHKKEHFKAVHFCYAYKIGAAGENYRANDDGEPSGSAGLPILAQIESKSLTNILVVVVRYFGGTLLGVPGLINAYKAATKDVLDKARIKKFQLQTIFFVELEYPDLNHLLYTAEKMQAQIIKRDMQANCKLDFLVPLRQKNNFSKYLQQKNLKFSQKEN